jgi:uncharacterized membrane protein
MPALLGISLALNLAIVAALAGAAWRHKSGGHNPARAAHGAAIYMQALPREARRAMRAQMRGANRMQMDATEMLTALREDPFDPSAAEGVLEAQRDAGLVRQTDASQLWLERIIAMSSNERNAYADRLQELSERRKARRKEWHGPEG